jgi:hypothetical protein
MTVTSAERFLMEAERCREQAAQAISEADRSAWLQMANDWIRLAAEAAPRKAPRRPAAVPH